MLRKPEWWNWQTRQVEGLVPVMGVQVQVLSPAIITGQGVTVIPNLLPFVFTGPLGKILVKLFA